MIDNNCAMNCNTVYDNFLFFKKDSKYYQVEFDYVNFTTQLLDDNYENYFSNFTFSKDYVLSLIKNNMNINNISKSLILYLLVSKKKFNYYDKIKYILK